MDADGPVVRVDRALADGAYANRWGRSGVRLELHGSSSDVIEEVRSPQRGAHVPPLAAATPHLFRDAQSAFTHDNYRSAFGVTKGALRQALEFARVEPRKPPESASILTRWMGVMDANTAGNVHGGVILRLCDEAAGLTAVRHSRGRVVTAGMDRMTFVDPVYIGQLVTCFAMVNAAWRTSVEVGRASCRERVYGLV